jgi:hypothetical protein
LFLIDPSGADRVQFANFNMKPHAKTGCLVAWLLTLTSVPTIAQVREGWVARYQDVSNAFAKAIAVDPKGNIYVTGGSIGEGGLSHCTTIKYDPEGNEIWMAHYDGPGHAGAGAAAIALDALGNVYVMGASWGGDDTSFDYATIKYDNDGNELWVAQYDGPAHGDDEPSAIAVDADGNVYVTGWSCNSRGPSCTVSSDYATIKYDSDGDELWVRRYRGAETGLSITRELGLDAQGNVYVSGTSSR